MNDNQAEYAAQLFRQQCAGVKLTTDEKGFLWVLLSRMDAPERTGAIAKAKGDK